jgi:hypothetical protein
VSSYDQSPEPQQVGRDEADAPVGFQTVGDSPARSVAAPDAGDAPPLRPADLIRLQQTAGNQAVARILLQRGPGTAARPKAPTPVPRDDVELMGAKLKMRSIDLSTFLEDAKKDVENIRGYFDWVTGVYSRCHGHYELVLSQAGAQAETAQKWVDFIFGVATGIGIGVMSEVIIAAKATEMGVELLAEAGAEVVEGAVGAVVKPEIPKPVPLKESAPEFKQIMALQNLDKLNQAVLGMAVPGATVYQDPIVQCERLIAELRVIEAGGERRMTDDEVRDRYLKLMQFSLRSLDLDRKVQEAKAKFEALRARYSGKQAPSDQRCEQDIWIPWLAKQNLNTFFAPTLMNELIRHHLADIGLTGRDKPGGRLGVKVDPIEGSPFGEPRAGEIQDHMKVAQDLKAAAAAAQGALPAYWNDVFLSG